MVEAMGQADYQQSGSSKHGTSSRLHQCSMGFGAKGMAAWCAASVWGFPIEPLVRRETKVQDLLSSSA